MLGKIFDKFREIPQKYYSKYYVATVQELKREHKVAQGSTREYKEWQKDENKGVQQIEKGDSDSRDREWRAEGEKDQGRLKTTK